MLVAILGFSYYAICFWFAYNEYPRLSASEERQIHAEVISDLFSRGQWVEGNYSLRSAKFFLERGNRSKTSYLALLSEVSGRISSCSLENQYAPDLLRRQPDDILFGTLSAWPSRLSGDARKQELLRYASEVGMAVLANASLARHLYAGQQLTYREGPGFLTAEDEAVLRSAGAWLLE